MTEKLRKALLTRLGDRSLVPDDTLIGVLTVNGVNKPGQMRRYDKESYAADIVEQLDYTTYLPQLLPLTRGFMTDVLDPVMSVSVPAGVYRVTMRKLLRLTLTQLQQQAELMKLDVLDLDQEGIAALILINMDEKTKLIPALAHALLSKEIAYVYGIRFQIPVRGPDHPSSTIAFKVTPTDMVQSVGLSKEDLLAECENQGIPVNRKENKRQLAIRLVVWWTEHADQVREPFTEGFKGFLLERAKNVGSY